MTQNILTLRPHVRRPQLLQAWLRRRAHAKQMRHLEKVTLDPHMARDLGLPVRERPKPRYDLM